jgi:hypothetical protein
MRLKIRQLMAYALIVALACASSACAFHRAYPARWPPPVEGETMAAFQGAFDCDGEDHSGNQTNTESNLGTMLSYDRTFSCDRLEVQIIGSSKIELSIYRMGRLVDRRIISCTQDNARSGNSIRLASQTQLQALGEGAIGWIRRNRYLLINRDNDLVVKEDEIVPFGLFFLIPVRWSEWRWYRYRRLANKAL